MDDILSKIIKESQGLKPESANIFDKIFAESKAAKPPLDLSFGGIMGKAQEAAAPLATKIGAFFAQGGKKLFEESKKQGVTPEEMTARVLESMGKTFGPEKMDVAAATRQAIIEKKIPGWIDEEGKPHLGEKPSTSPMAGWYSQYMALAPPEKAKAFEEQRIPIATPFLRQLILNAINTGTFGAAEKIQPGFTLGAEGLEPTLAGQLGGRAGDLIGFIWGGPMRAGHLAGKLMVKGAQKIFPWLGTANKAAVFTNRVLSGTASLSAASAAERAIQGPEAALEAAKEGGVTGAMFAVAGLIDPKSKALGQVLRNVGFRAISQAIGRYDVTDFRDIPNRVFTEAFDLWFLRKGVTLKKQSDYIKLQDELKRQKAEIDNLNVAGRKEFGEAWKDIRYNPMLIPSLIKPELVTEIQKMSQAIMSEAEYNKAMAELPRDHPLALPAATAATGFEVLPTGEAIPTAGGLRAPTGEDIVARYRAAEPKPQETAAPAPVAVPATPPPAPGPPEAPKRARPRGEALAPEILTAADIGKTVQVGEDFKGFSIVWNKGKKIKGTGTVFEVLANYPGRAQESVGWMSRAEIRNLAGVQKGLLAAQKKPAAPPPTPVAAAAPEAPAAAPAAPEAPKPPARVPGSSEIPDILNIERTAVESKLRGEGERKLPFREVRTMTDALEKEFRAGNPDVQRTSGRDGYSYTVERPYGKLVFTPLGDFGVSDVGFKADAAKSYVEARAPKPAEEPKAEAKPPAPSPKPAWVGPYEELINNMQPAFRKKETGEVIIGEGKESHADIRKRLGLPETTDPQQRLVEGFEPGFVGPDRKFYTIDDMQQMINKTRAQGQEEKKGEPEPAAPKTGLVELRHYTTAKLPEGYPTTPDARGMVWLTEGESYLKGENYVSIEFPNEKIFRIDENPELLRQYLKSPFGKKGRSKENELLFAESLGYEAVKRGNDVASRPEYLGKYVKKPEEAPEPPAVEKLVAAANAPPGDRWTADMGATPGEPSQFLDGDPYKFKAAIIEQERGENVIYEAVLANGKSIGKYQSLEQASKAAEKYVDANPREVEKALREIEEEGPELTLEQEAEAPRPAPKAPPAEQPKLLEEPKGPPPAYPKPFKRDGTMSFKNINKWAELVQPLIEEGWVIEYGHRMGKDGWARIIEKREPGQGRRISAGGVQMGEADEASKQLGLSEEETARLPLEKGKKPGAPKGPGMGPGAYNNLVELVAKNGGMNWQSVVRNRETGEAAGILESDQGKRIIRKRGGGKDIEELATIAKEAGLIESEDTVVFLEALDRDIRQGKKPITSATEEKREAEREAARYEREAEAFNESIADEVSRLKARLESGEKWESLDKYERDLLMSAGEWDYIESKAPKEEVEAERKRPEITRDTIEERLLKHEKLSPEEEKAAKDLGILEEVEAKPARELSDREIYEIKDTFYSEAKAPGPKVRKARVTITDPLGNSVEEEITEELLPELDAYARKLKVQKNVKYGTVFEGKWREKISPKDQLRYLKNYLKDVKEKPKEVWREWLEGGGGVVKMHFSGGGVNTRQVLEKHVSNVNMARVLDERLDDIGPNYDAKKYLADLVERYEAEGEKARGGTISLERTEQLADALNIPVETLMNSLRRKTKSLHVYITASRDALITSAIKVKSLGEIYSLTKAPEDLAKFEMALARHRMIQNSVMGGTAEAGRALSAFRIYSKAKPFLATKQYEKILRLFGNREIPAEVARRIATLNMDDPLAVLRFIREVEPATNAQKVYEVWINWGLLSGLKTHVRNITSNAITAIMAPIEKAYAAGADYLASVVKGRERSVFFREVPAEFFGMMQGIPEGVRRALFAWRNELTMAGVSKLEHTTKAAIKGELGKKVRIPGRALLAADEFFKGVIYSGQIHTQSYRKALSEGLKGEALKKRVAEIVADPPEAIKESAMRAALKRTFQEELGHLGKEIMAARDKVWPLKYVVPFVKTPTNIVKYALERTPLNLVRMRRMKLAGELTPDVFAEEMGKIAFGSMIAAGIGALFAQGKISGGGPKNKEEREALYRTGWMPYSIKVGDKWYQYGALEPYGMLFGVSTDFFEAMDAIGEKPGSEIAAKIVLSVANNLTSKTYVKGLTDALNAIQDFDRYGKTWIEHFAGTAIPTVVAQANRAADPYMREVRSFLDYFKSRIPGAAQTIPVKRDIYGQPVEKTGTVVSRLLSPVEVSREKGTGIDRELLRLGIRVGRPQITMGAKGKEKRLTPEQYDEYSVLVGQQVERWLGNIISNANYAKLSDERKKEVLESALTRARAKARRMFIYKYREFAR